MGSAASSVDEIVELFKSDVDRSLIRENLRLTPTQRLQQLEAAQRFATEVREIFAELEVIREELRRLG